MAQDFFHRTFVLVEESRDMFANSRVRRVGQTEFHHAATLAFRHLRQASEWEEAL